MKSYSVSTRINATPETVWKILTDIASYPSWEGSYTKVEGRVSLGEKLVVHHKERNPKVLPLKVSVYEPEPPTRRMVWVGGGMPEAIFKGERIFSVSGADSDVAEFSMQLVFSGVMAPVITKTIPDMQPDLEQFAAALKKRAEAAAERGSV